MRLTGAQIITEVLAEQGVSTVFGVPGNSVLSLYDALHQNRHGIRHILTCHEQAAAHAADGYARVTGRPGVVIATSGPGATNLVTGLAAAMMDSSPVVAITGNVPTTLLGRDSFQEVDIFGVTLPITKHNYIVKRIDALADTLREAFFWAGAGRPGPLLVDVPRDIQAAECEFTPQTPRVYAAPAASEDTLRAAAALLAQAKRPLLFAGGGVLRGGAEAEFLALARALDAPAAMSFMALSALPPDEPLSLGLLGMHGTPQAVRALREADVILAAGTRFSDRVAGEAFAPQAKLIHLDIDAAELSKNVPAALSLRGDAKKSLAGLLSLLPPAARPDWRARVDSFRESAPSAPGLSPETVLRQLYQAMGDAAVVATDVGQHQMWTGQYYPLARPRALVSSGGLGAMGFGMGAAIGACLAQKNAPTLLVTGDGSFHMNLSELATAVRYRLPIVIAVMHNGALGMVRQWQALLFDGRYAESSPERTTDFVKVAEGFGARGARVTSPEELAAALSIVPQLTGPYVLEIPIDPDERVLPVNI